MSDCVGWMQFQFRIERYVSLLLLLVATCSIVASDVRSDEIRIDCDRVIGTIRPLHGVNGGPLNYGETVDLSAYWRELKIPLTRLHDCEWPTPAVVDIHAVFPSLAADPELPGSYQFQRTDDYLKSIADTGTGVVYRLGESIEHSRRKYHVHPPADNDRWTAACIGIIRHINEGWADGTHREIRYWEIWNEPENRPAMWTGSDADFYRLYGTAAKGIKSRFPELKVGGPSVGYTGEVINGKLKASPFLENFIKHCGEHSIPLDFFSWHTYADNPRIYAAKARAIRNWLNEHGFAKTEIHLNEWNYLPGNDWTALSVAGQGVLREKWYAEMGGENGASFLTDVLIDLQDSPVDVANFYCGDTNPFGLFSRHGVPKKTYFAMLAFRKLLDTPQRIEITSSQLEQIAACAGTNRERTQISILLSNFQGKERELNFQCDNVPWKGPSTLEVFAVDSTRDLDQIALMKLEVVPLRQRLTIPSQGVVLVKLQQAK